MTKDEALKLALEALEKLEKHNRGVKITTVKTGAVAYPAQIAQEAITAIKEALANVPTSDTSEKRVDEMAKQRHEPEPVIDKSAAVRIATSLGWEPKRKPLTDEEIMEMYNEPRSDAEMIEFARAIEAAHGIWPENSDCYGPDWTDRDGEYLK